MNIIVIGGTGAIGVHVVRQLANAGHAVTIFHRGEHDPPGLPDVRHVHAPGAAMCATSFPAELRSPAPDVVVHMIPMGSADAGAAAEFFRGHARRIVGISSGDVYRAYGRLTRIEPGSIEPSPLTEGSPLRSVLHPYRKMAKSETDLQFWYEKILAERELQAHVDLPCTILRLGKVYGADTNADFASVYPFREHPRWRWTHVYVENVAAAIVLSATHERTGIFNVGEEHTPTVAERLPQLLPSEMPSTDAPFDFDQDIVLDSSRIRRELGFREIVDYEEGLRRTLRR